LRENNSGFVSMYVVDITHN